MPKVQHRASADWEVRRLRLGVVRLSIDVCLRTRPPPTSSSTLPRRNQQHECPLPLARFGRQHQRVVPIPHRVRDLDRHRRCPRSVVTELSRHRLHGNASFRRLSADLVVAGPVDHPLHVDGHIRRRPGIHRHQSRRDINRQRQTPRLKRRRRRRCSGPPRLVRLRRKRELQLTATRKQRLRQIRLVGRPPINM